MITQESILNYISTQDKTVKSCFDELLLGGDPSKLQPAMMSATKTVLKDAGVPVSPTKKWFLEIAEAYEVDEIILLIHEVCRKKEAGWSYGFSMFFFRGLINWVFDTITGLDYSNSSKEVKDQIILAATLASMYWELSGH